MNSNITLKITSPNDKKAIEVIDELSSNLYLRFGSDGKNSFTDWEYTNSKFIFVIAEIENEVVGCGAIRPINKTVGEVKRMYAKYPRKRIGQTILTFLEKTAISISYTGLVLETRLKNQEAMTFYKKSGYDIIPNYGKYINRPEAICLGKLLV